MPWLSIPEDHCRTAADVRMQCSHIIKVRRVNKTPFWIQAKYGWQKQETKPAPAPPPLPTFPQSKADRIEEVLNFVCGYFGVSRYTIAKKNKTDECLNPRAVICYLLRVAVKLSFRDIGSVIARGDTSAICGYFRAEKLLTVDPNHQVTLAISAGSKRFGIIIERRAPPLARDDVQHRVERDQVIPYEMQISTIVRLTAYYFDLDPSMMVSDRRTKDLMQPRHIAMYLCMLCTKRSVPAIGREMCRDHTSVLHGYRRIDAKVKAGNIELITDIQNLKDAINGQELKLRTTKPQELEKQLKRRPFSNEDVAKIKEMVVAGESNKVIAKTLGRSRFSIETKIRYLDVKRDPGLPHRGLYSEGEIFTLTSMVHDGFSTREIAEALGRAPQSVADKILLMKLGDRRASKSFSAEENAKVEEMWRAGASCPEICRAVPGRARSSIRDKIVALEKKHALSPNTPIEGSPAVLHP